jgi:hypothetical protein
MPEETSTQQGDRTSTLAATKGRAQKIHLARERLELISGDIRRRVTALSFFIPGLPLAGLVARLAESQHHPGAGFAVLTLISTPVLINVVMRGVERLYRARHEPDAVYQRVLDKCVELGPMPAPVDAALDQALEAYFALRKLGEEPDWKRVGYPLDDHLRRASERVVELLEWGRRISIIGDRLEKTRGEGRETPEFRETQTHFLAQCAQLAAAAAAFNRVEAKVTLAYATLSASAARDTLAAGQLQELTATFEALTEVLSESEPGSRIVPPAEEQQVLIQGR